MDYSNVIFPSAVGTVISYLKPVAGVPVWHSVPRESAEGYVRVSRNGGPMVNPVTDGAIVTISCYHVDAFEAELLANKVRGLMLGIRGKRVGDVWVRWWVDGGPAEYPDPDTRMTRYQFTGQLNLKIN